jgi:regulation of enolase protein 1 (concanavalin A-like superfamily)
MKPIFVGSLVSCRRKNQLKRYLRLELLEHRTLMCADGLSPEHLLHRIAGESSTQSFLSDSSIQRSLEQRIGPMQEVVASTESDKSSYFSLAVSTFATRADGMPILNSLPSAPTAIYLDLDGDSVTSTDPYDEDGDPTTFNTTEQNNITEAWRQIATYFVMFDVDVTTVPTSKPKAWLASGNNISGGYSYVNVFPNSQPRSFNQSSNVRTRVSGLAHELGHNFGLSHQKEYDLLGNLTAEYSDGYDSFHGPIMGVDYAQSIHKWFIGHAGSASTLQNDMSVIANEIKAYQAAGGDGYRADDFGGTIATATALTLTGGTQSIAGIIERHTDIDAFSFTSLGGEVDIAALADDPSAVDLKLEIYDALGVLLASKDSNTSNDQSISLVLPVGTFYVMVSGHRNYGDVGAYNLTLRSMPTNWTSRDIGSVGSAGYSEFNATNNTYQIIGSGADIGGTADQMQFAMQTLTGNGEIIARLASLTNTGNGAEAGIEFREATATGSQHVSLTQTWANGQQLKSRETADGATVTQGAATQAFTAKWLKLARVGNVFTGSVSDDGVTWTVKGTTTVAMNSRLLVGLVSSSGDNTKRTNARFTNVSLTGNLGTPAPTVNSLPAPSGFTLARSVGSDLTVSWTDGTGETGYRIERSSDGVNFSTVTTTAADVTTYEDKDLFGSLRYYYRVRAVDASGVSTPTAVKNIVNRPNAVTNFKVTSLNTTTTVLNWRDTHGESGYRIESSADGVTFTTLGTVGTNVPSYTHSGLTTATRLTYRVIPTSTLGDGEVAEVDGSTRLAKVGGLTFTNVASTSITFKWSNIAGETNYRLERSTNGTDFTTLATVGADVTTYTDSTVTAVNDYYYRVVGTSPLTESISDSNVIFTATPATSPLPTPWTATDIGDVNGDGATSLSSGTFKVVSSGAEIDNALDAFRFTSQSLQGDASITARVATIQDTAAGAKLGVMIRESLAPDAKHVMVVMRPTNGIIMQSRSTVGGTTANSGTLAEVAPFWVRLTRVGNLFTGYTSADGITWTQLGTKTLTMPANVHVGLAATAGSTTLMNTGTVTNVEVIGDARVMNRQVFYNNSGSIFGSGSGNPLNSIDSSVVPLLPGQTTSTINNFTNYSRGLNGIIVDLDRPQNLAGINSASFQFAVWNNFTTTTPNFTSITPAITVSTFATGGVGGSSRVKLVLPDNAVQNAWLRITILANEFTGLPTNDVFYFGNARYDVTPTSSFPSQVTVNAFDTNAVRAGQGNNPGIVTNRLDVDRNGAVNAFDINGVRANQGVSSLRPFTAPASQSFSLALLPSASPPVASAPDSNLVDDYFASIESEQDLRRSKRTNRSSV